MVATTTSSTVSATPAVDTSNLAKGLFTDLSPLLALFGDEVTKQFLSMSLGFGDDLLLAIAPIGVITIIVSAIRVGGYPWMKTLIGRARDSPDDEEKELLSSTSSSVREIWNGHRVIRQTGESQALQLVFREGRSELNDIDILVLGTLQDKLENRGWVVERFKERCQSSFLRPLLCLFGRDCLVRGICEEEEGKGDLDDIKLITLLMRKKAPNLTINIPEAITDPMYLWLCVTIGAILQCLVFFFNAYVVYHKHWLRAGARVASYGFPLWASGTLSIIVGLFMCGYVIENTTTQYVAKPNIDKNSYVVRFQKPMPLMNLPAYAFLYKDSQVLISQRTTFVEKRRISDLAKISEDIKTDPFLQKTNRMAFNTLLGTGFALSGFILQNLGTRELHFSASVAQLIATLALTILRSWVRRNAGIPPPDCKELKRGIESTHMISEVCGIGRLVNYAKCSRCSTDGSTSRLRIDSNTNSFFRGSLYQRYANRLLTTQSYLKELDLAPGQDQFLLDKATKAIAFFKHVGITSSVRKRILFCGQTQDSLADTDHILDSDPGTSEGTFYLPIFLDPAYKPDLRLAALWSFCFCDFYQLRSEISDFHENIMAFHIVAVGKVANYKTKFELLSKYIGDRKIIAWRVDSDNKLTLLDGTWSPLRNPDKDNWPLFGHHYLRKNGHEMSMLLEEDDVIITYANSHRFSEHLVADTISSGLLGGTGGHQRATANPSRYGDREGELVLKNDYFESLADELKDCISDRDLGLAAIIPAYIHTDNMPHIPDFE